MRFEGAAAHEKIRARQAIEACGRSAPFTQFKTPWRSAVSGELPRVRFTARTHARARARAHARARTHPLTPARAPPRSAVSGELPRVRFEGAALPAPRAPVAHLEAYYGAGCVNTTVKVRNNICIIIAR